MADREPVFVDVETTGLEPDRHRIWEVALIDGGDEYHAVMEMRGTVLAEADREALKVSRFFERTEPYRPIEGLGAIGGAPEKVWDDPSGIALMVAGITEGRIIAGFNPWFDAAFLDRLLRGTGWSPAWDYHLVDVKTFAAGWLAGRLREGGGIRQPPWHLDDLCVQLGINPGDHGADRHTAMGDARLAKAIYEAVMRHG